MASAAEQLAANLNFSAFAKAPELKKRIWFTLGALVVYRLGTYIPLPGIDPTIWQDIFARQAEGFVGIINTFAGGALERMTIFALNIMPYISAAIIMQLMTAVSPKLEALKKEGAVGQKKINQYTRYLTVFITILQAYGISVGLESMQSTGGGSAVIDPGYFFRFTTVVSLVGGTMFLLWLGEEMGRTGQFSAILIISLLVMAIVVIALIVFVERAQRRLIVQYPKRQRGNKMTGGESSHLPLKLNTAGVIPPIFASAILLMPLTVAGFSAGSGPEWLTAATAFLGRGQPVYFIIYSSLIAFFAFFYTAVVFNPKDTADNLKKYGGFIPGIRPGKNTAEYLDWVLTRLTVIGAIYLVAVCMMPEILISKYSVPFYLGGTSLLIVVTVTIDTVAQVQSHLLAHQYEGLIKKSKLKGRR
jgi:preprotein translocase subunit SecY